MTLPRHIAIIMDGNGRWASARKLPRLAGHQAGMQALRGVVAHAADIGLEWLTVYAFSSENWSRPVEEVNHLLSLLKLFIKRDLAQLHERNVRVRMIGARENLADDIGALLDKAENLTAGNSGLNLVVAFNYGARDEIVRAARALVQDVQTGKLQTAQINAQSFAERLDTVDIPDPDFIIRTSGEMRLSNFLLWQAAYAELSFVPCYWPDFSAQDFDAAIAAFCGRERRFGALGTAECRKDAAQ